MSQNIQFRLINQSSRAITMCCALIFALMSSHATGTSEAPFAATTDTTYIQATEWSDSVQRLIGLLQGLLQKINAGYYTPPYNTEHVPLWVRSQIDELYRYRKKALTKVKRPKIVSLAQVTISYVQQLQALISTHFAVMPTISIETTTPIDSPSESSDLKKLSQELDLLDELIESCGITTINRIARGTERVTDLIDSYTHIYFLFENAQWLPLFLIWLRQNLSKDLLHTMPSWLYNEHAPRYKLGFDSWIMRPEIENIKSRRNSRIISKLAIAEFIYVLWLKAFFISLSIQYVETQHAPESKMRKLIDGTRIKLLLDYIANVPTSALVKFKEYWSKLKGIPPSPSEISSNVVYDIDFDDEGLIGLEQQKEQVSDIIAYMRDPEGYVSRGHMIQKGVLLIGPPRTRKTIFARATAGTINKYFRQDGKKTELKFIELTYDSINKLDSPEAFERLIAEMRTQAPCILFIDELHTYDPKASGNRGLYNTLLTTMEALYRNNDPTSQIIIIGATTRPDLIASELRTHKRFGKEIFFDLPDYGRRQEFFKKTLNELAVDQDTIKIDSYVRQTVGCNYGHLQSVVASAKFKAKNIEIQNAHIQEALDQEIHRLVNECHLTDREKALLAAHQAGHALMLHLLKPAATLEFVTIRGFYTVPTSESQDAPAAENPHLEYGKIVRYNPDEALDLLDHRDVEKNIQILVAGHKAETLLLGTRSHNYHADDHSEALKLAQQLIQNQHQSDLKVDTDFDYDNNQQAHEILAAAEKIVQETLQKNKGVLTQIADQLKKKLTLTAQDISEIAAQQESQPLEQASLQTLGHPLN